MLFQMRDLLRNTLPFVLLLAVVVALGLGVEWRRRAGLRRLAAALGGTFEAGTLVQGVVVPEAAPFDGPPGQREVHYSDVIRLLRPEATFVLARRQEAARGTSRSMLSSRSVVCLVVLPAGSATPPLDRARELPGWIAAVAEVRVQGPVVLLQGVGGSAGPQHRELYDLASGWLQAARPRTEVPALQRPGW